MSLLNRKRSILWKIESSYGVDSVPTGAANAILCTNPEVTPIEGQTVSRDLLRAYFGNSEQLPTAIYSKVMFDVEIAGAGTAGQAAPWGPLLRSCGFAETLLGAAHTDTAQAGGASTITLAAAGSATDDAYLGMRVRTTGGTGSGQKRTIIDYNGTTKVATVDSPWTTPPDNTTVYSVDACALYAPVSDAFEAGTGYFNVDGVLHALLGARGTVNLNLTNNQIPRFSFEMSGIYVPVSDAAVPTQVLTAWKQPRVVNKVNTPGASLHGYAGTIESFTTSLANEVQFRSLPGGIEQVLITDRKPTGTLSMEATTVAAKDWWTAVRNATLGSAVIEHGIDAGNIVRVTAPQAQIVQPRYADSQGVAMLNTNLSILPLAGNDDLFICAM